MDFLTEVNLRTKEPSPVDNKLKTRKSAITRTTSESGISEHQTKRSGIVFDTAIVEDDIFADKQESVKNGLDQNGLGQSSKDQTRAIFSDSEGVDVKSVSSPKKSGKGKGPAHTHKRSRSDIVGGKTTLTSVGFEGQGQGSEAVPSQLVGNPEFYLGWPYLY